MVLSINSPTNTIITISSTLLDDFIATPASYTDIDIQIYFNSTTDSTTETYSNSVPITGVTNVATNAGVETINPAFFGATEFAQGIYHVVIALTSDAEIQTDEGCLFVEDTIACDVNTYRLDTTHTLQQRIDAGLDYYMLTKSQDCTCGCDDLTEIYNNLVIKLDSNPCTTC